MKKLLPILLLSYCSLVLLLSCSLVSAQTTPGWTPACDPCGFCVGGQKPAQYDECVACLQNKGYDWTVLGCIPTTPGGFIQTILQVAVRVIGGIAFLSFLYGGFMLLTSGGDIEKINKGKTIVASSVIGLLMVIFSVFILKVVGFEILRIPGFGP